MKRPIFSLLGSNWAIVACVGHALLITVLWALVFKVDIVLVPASLWLSIALLWLMWLIAPIFSPAQAIRRWLIAELLSIVVLAPSAPAIYTFSVWAIGGFAP